MNIIELREQIINKKLQHIYYFTGPEWKIMSMYVHKICELAKAKLEYANDVKEIFDTATNNNLFSSMKCFVILNDKDFLNNEDAWTSVEQTNKQIIIFIYTELDKRCKFYKQNKDKIIEFNHLNEETLVRYIQKEINLNTENAKVLARVCENDYGKILFEIDKIKRYIWKIEDTQEGKSRFDLAFEQLVKDGTIYTPPRDAIFDLIDAILTKNEALAYKLYRDCIDVGEANLVILLNLFNATRATLQVQTCHSSDISKTTGLKQGVIYGCQKRLYRYSEKGLIDLMRLIQRVEMGIKIGTIDEKIAVDYILVKTFGGIK